MQSSRSLLRHQWIVAKSKALNSDELPQHTWNICHAHPKDYYAAFPKFPAHCMLAQSWVVMYKTENIFLYDAVDMAPSPLHITGTLGIFIAACVG